MNPDRTYLDYLEDMREAIQLIAEFTQRMTFEQFKWEYVAQWDDERIYPWFSHLKNC